MGKVIHQTHECLWDLPPGTHKALHRVRKVEEDGEVKLLVTLHNPDCEEVK